jgi:acyl-CoA synthetase (AMP-forming)/AMP-acid ligase II
MVIRSPFPDLSIPDEPLARYVFANLDRHAGRPALIDGETGAVTSHGELHARVVATAAGFAARGIGPGDVVGLYSPNVPDYATAFLGVAMAGATNTTANALYGVHELAYQLRDCGARLLITHPVLAPVALDAARAVGIDDVLAFGDADGTQPFDALLVAGDAPDVAVTPARDVVSLPYSSGTTGLSKGVRLTHTNLVANVHQLEAIFAWEPDDVVIGVLPFFHIYGQTVVMAAALRAGASIVTMARFDLERYLSLIQEHRATRLFVAPPIVLAFAKHPLVDEYDLSSVRHVMSGAAPLDAQVAAQAAARIGCRVIQGYGMTEASPVITCTSAFGEDRPGSVGPLVANTEGRIVDPGTGRDVPVGEPGELWARGPQVMPGYLGNPEATAATIVDGGWLRTGDIAVADADGWITITDRVKELIKVKGYQVAPAELEALLLTHPSVTDACVIPIPDEEAGERPKAFVVLRDPVSAEELIAWVSERSAPHKRLAAVEVVDEVPKSASGKILRRVLVEQERGRASPEASAR